MGIACKKKKKDDKILAVAEMGGKKKLNTGSYLVAGGIA
jgi:hypothetical protein